MTSAGGNREELDSMVVEIELTLCSIIQGVALYFLVDNARLVLSRRPLWILDEPATALDGDGVTLLTTIVRQHLDANRCAVIATHQPLGLPSDRAATLVLDARSP